VTIQLCNKSVARLGAGAKPMLSSLREQEHSVVLKDCLERCQACDKGLIIATVDGMPLSAIDAAAFVDKLAQLAADE
jgi:hypothetical protein